MSFADERQAFAAEFEAHYSAMPNDVSEIEHELRNAFAAEPDASPYVHKTRVYQAVSERCPVKVFRHYPFAFEVGVGKPRTDLGSGGVGESFKRRPFGRKLMETGSAWWKPCIEAGLSVGWPVLDDNHHCLGMDNVLTYGIDGLASRAHERIFRGVSREERRFLDCMISGLDAQLRLAERFADEAEFLLVTEDEPVVRARFERIAATMRRVPAKPPQTFFEGLATVLFMRETTQALEGAGISILCHVDRLLWPLYERDLAEGRTTRAEAKGQLAWFLAMSDARFGIDAFGDHVGTNTTIMIGGCDRTGAPVFNDITRMVAEVYAEHRFVDPKLNARVSAASPDEYYELLARLMSGGCNSVSVFNDDVIIPANVNMGKAPQDCRLYAGGGCQENVLENTEINSRATMYVNLAAVFLMGSFPEQWAFFSERDGIDIRPHEDCTTFEEFYSAFLANVESVVRAHVSQRNSTEREGVRFNPMPLHSATIDDCIENARDIMAGGARYSFGSVSLAGIGTIIDSLYAVKEAVFDRRMLPLGQLRCMLANDFAGEEAFRGHLVNRIPKFGQDDPAIREFSAKVFADIARVSRGHKNTRGGEYEPSLFSFRSFTHLGERTGATPDGRRAGEHVSPGMSPSKVALGRECSVSQVLRALEPVDMTDYPVVAVLDVKMPVSPGRYGPEVLATVVRCFVDCGGSVLQINSVDPAVLLEAREHPERHPDLVVRISGYSAYFRTLPAAVMDEVIERTVAGA